MISDPSPDSSALKPDGIVVITIPQHMWLWSSVDEHALHKRRYSRNELRRKLAAAGFSELRVTSFVTTLLPVMCAARFMTKWTKQNSHAAGWSELEISTMTNRICAAAMRFDEALIHAGVSLPAGGSLLAVARKKPV